MLASIARLRTRVASFPTWYDANLIKHPIKTKMTSAAILATFGDFLSQNIQYHSKEPREQQSVRQHDYARSTRIAVWYAFGSALPGHYWYTYIVEWIVRSKGRGAVFKKILCDEFIFTPPLHAVFFLSQAKMQGKGNKEAWDHDGEVSSDSDIRADVLAYDGCCDLLGICSSPL